MSAHAKTTITWLERRFSTSTLLEQTGSPRFLEQTGSPGFRVNFLNMKRFKNDNQSEVDFIPTATALPPVSAPSIGIGALRWYGRHPPALVHSAGIGALRQYQRLSPRCQRLLSVSAPHQYRCAPPVSALSTGYRRPPPVFVHSAGIFSLCWIRQRDWFVA